MANIITPEAILSYVNSVFTPSKASEDADPKYSCTFVFPVGTDIKELKAAVIEVAKEKWGDKLKGAKLAEVETQHGPANFLVAGALRIRLPWRDNPELIAGKGYPEGSSFVRASGKNAPGVVATIPDPSNDNKPAQVVSLAGDVRLRDGTVIPAARPIYSGTIGRGLLSVFTYDVNGNRGVSFGLNGVQVIRDGERLDGRTKAEDAFEADMESAPDLSDLTGEGEPAEAGAATGGDDLTDLIG